MIQASIAITYSSSSLQKKAEQLALKLQCPSIANDENIKEYDFILLLDEKKLSLQFQREPHFKPLFIDFSEGTLAYRTQHDRQRHELIAKACGIKKNIHPSIIDTTAGLGRDAFILASLGCQVTMIERNPVMLALLEDGLARWQQQSTLSISLTLVGGDARNYLAHCSLSPDVIYLDPMHPSRSKSALVKKEMRILRELVGDDTDTEELFILAKKVAKKRVVVKRPRLAEYITEAKPDLQFKGRSSRFDVYTSRS